jgi:topoisomerase IA-like protein
VECRIVKERTGKVSEKEIARLEAQRAYLKDLRKRNAEEEAKKKKKPKKRTTSKKTTAKRTTAKRTTAKKTTAKRGGKGGQMKIF